MVIFNSYVKLPEGIYTSFLYVFVPWKVDPQAEQEIQQGQDVGVGQSCHLSPFYLNV